MSGTDIGAIMSGIGALILAFVQVWLARKREKEKPRARQGRGRFPSLDHPWVLIFCVVLALTSIGLVTGPRMVGTTLAIHLTYPEDGSSVPLEITAKGYATGELNSKQHLYIVVEYGGRWWPQYSEATIGYSQTTKRYEFSSPARIGKEEDVGKIFAVRAILVDSAIHQHFQGWLQQHTATGEWTGIPITEVNQWGKVQICDSITVTRH